MIGSCSTVDGSRIHRRARLAIYGPSTRTLVAVVHGRCSTRPILRLVSGQR
jgi:hypothetical protein